MIGHTDSFLISLVIFCHILFDFRMKAAVTQLLYSLFHLEQIANNSYLIANKINGAENYHCSSYNENELLSVSVALLLFPFPFLFLLLSYSFT